MDFVGNVFFFLSNLYIYRYRYICIIFGIDDFQKIII